MTSRGGVGVPAPSAALAGPVRKKRVGEDYLPPVPAYAETIPPLPPIYSINPDQYVGPTEESNWVIFGRLLVGAYPASVHDDANTRILTNILRLGCTTFVCLQQELVWRPSFLPLPAHTCGDRLDAPEGHAVLGPLKLLFQRGPPLRPLPAETDRFNRCRVKPCTL